MSEQEQTLAIFQEAVHKLGNLEKIATELGEIKELLRQDNTSDLTRAVEDLSRHLQTHWRR